ncbi:MAG TPA: hypothetical protein VIA18_13045 [Polyangia bacterium]|nr:hypothetical protein [Polyangia bacterium]
MRAKAKETLFREVIVERVRGGRGTKRVHGWLVAPVAVGGHLVVRQDDERQMTSTPIRRLLVEDQGSHVVYVETQNSRYRVTFVSSTDEANKGARVSATVNPADREVEVTLVEDVLSKAGNNDR